MFTEDIRQGIRHENRDELKTFDIDDMIKALDMMIDYPVDEENLVGIRSETADLIARIYGSSLSRGEDDYELLAKSLFNIEPHLKKLLYMTDRTAYEELKNSKDFTCGPVIDRLGIAEGLRQHGHINLKARPEDYADSNRQEDHILRAYALRNADAHELREWSRAKLYRGLQDVMVTLLYACFLNRTKISELYSKSDLAKKFDPTDYLRRIVDKYRDGEKAGFKFIQIRWTHHAGSTIDSRDTVEERADVKALMSRLDGVKHVELLGGAGCGKTTSVEYMQYQDAKNRLSDESAPIPVTIRLGESGLQWLMLEEAISDELGVVVETARKLLLRKELKIYLDGVNEMVSSLEQKTRIVNDIERFLAEYPDLCVLITDRENVEIAIDSKLDIYYLHSMDREDVRSYITEKMDDEAGREEILSYVMGKGARDMRYTPIILDFLIDHVKRGEGLPEDKYELYVKYIDSLLEREYKVKKDINAAPGRLDTMLAYLADRMENGSMPRVAAQKTFAECIQKLGMSRLDSEECLKLSLQLGILVEQRGRIAFENEEFENALFAKAAELGIDEV